MKNKKLFAGGIIVGILAFCLMAVGPVDKILVRYAKGTPVTVHSAVSTDVAVGSTTAIDMTNFDALMVELIVNSGTTGVSVTPYFGDTATGTFYVGYRQAEAAGGAWEALPALTATTASRAYMLKGLKGKFVKLPADLTGTTNITIKATPAP